MDYEALSTLNISATQELMKIISRQGDELNTFKQTTVSKDEFEKLKADMEMLNNLLGTKAESDKNDQYFNKGYGKMYLMR